VVTGPLIFQDNFKNLSTIDPYQDNHLYSRAFEQFKHRKFQSNYSVVVKQKVDYK